MKESLVAMALVAAALAGCQSIPVSAKGTPNSMLINAGFVAKLANTPEQVALLNSLPPNQFVQQTVNGKATYLYADPARAAAFMSEARVHSRASKACRTSCTT